MKQIRILKDKNPNDSKILAYCHDESRTINELASMIDISPASVSARVKKLEEDKKVMVTRLGPGKKTRVRSAQGLKVIDYMVEILSKIKDKGSVTPDEYTALLSYDPSYFGIIMATWNKIRPQQIRILKDLYSKEPKTLSELHRNLKIAYKEIHRHIKSLEAIGYVHRERKTKEKNTPVYVTLSKLGRYAIRTSIEGQEQDNDKMDATFMLYYSEYVKRNVTLSEKGKEFLKKHRDKIKTNRKERIV